MLDAMAFGPSKKLPSLQAKWLYISIDEIPGLLSMNAKVSLKVQNH